MQPPALTALVVDDDRVSRRLIQQALIESGVVPLCCSDPRFALTILAENRPFDLVVTDFQMPRMNGREFVQELRASEQWRGIPVIMVSGVISLKQINDMLGSGVDYFLPKPLVLSDLIHYVKLCCKQAQQKPNATMVRPDRLSGDRLLN